MKRGQEFAKNGAILSIGTIFPKLTSLITLPIITDCLSKQEYGIYDTITVLVLLVLPVATLQMQASAFRFLVSKRGDSEEQKKIISNILFFTLPVCTVALAVMNLFLKRIDGTTRLLMTAYFMVDILLITIRQIVRGLSRNDIYSASAFISSFTEMICMYVFLSKLHRGLNGAITALALSQALSLVYLTIAVKIHRYIDIKMVSVEDIKSLLSYSWPLVPNSLSSWAVRTADKLVLIAVMGAEAEAVYGVANKLPNMFNLVQTTFTMAWQENASVSVEDQDSEEYFGSMFDTVFSFFTAAIAGLIAFTPVIFKILIRGDYSESYNHMPILYIAMLFSTVASYVGGIYIAHLKTKEIGITTAIAALLNFLLISVLIKKIGIYAASLATLISYLWLAVYRMVDVQKIQKIRFNIKRIIAFVLILSLMAFVCFQRNTVLDLINMGFSILFACLINGKLIKSILEVLKRKGTDGETK